MPRAKKVTMAVDPDFVFHLVTGGPIDASVDDERVNPVRKSLQEKVDKIREVNLERNGAQGLDRVLVVVLGNQDPAEWTAWPGLVTSWFWQGVPVTHFQPALTMAKSVPLPSYEASLKKPIVMTNRGILVRGQKVSSFHVVGSPGPNERGSRACGMQFLDELWDSARDAQAQLTAYDDNVEVHLYLSKSDPESVSLVHKWCKEKGVEMPPWLNKPSKTSAAKATPSDMCPGMDRLESILKPAEMELLQTQYEVISGEGEGEGLTRQVEPILCTAGRFAKIKAAVRGFMPDDLFDLMFAAASSGPPLEDNLDLEDDIIIIETTQEGFPSDSRVHPRDRLGVEITDLRSVIGGGSSSHNNRNNAHAAGTQQDSALRRLGSPVASNPIFDHFGPSSSSGGGRQPPRLTDAPRSRSPRPSRSSPSAWGVSAASRSPRRPSRSSPERDELVLVRREKDVYMIKNENAYIRYLQEMPIDRRTLRMPWTPDISRKRTGGDWDKELMNWRREVHQFDPNAPPQPRIRSRSRSPLRSRSPARKRNHSGPSARELIGEENRRIRESLNNKRLFKPMSPEPLEDAPKQTDPAVLEGRKRLLNDLAWNFPRFKPVYDRYVKAVPKDQRRPDMPRTPDVHQPNYVNSKQFSNQVSAWKQAIYALGDSPGQGCSGNDVVEQRKGVLDALAWNLPQFRKVYDRYAAAVPKGQRRPDIPRTPDVHMDMGITKSGFTKRVCEWKKQVYALGDDGTIDTIEKRNRTVSYVKRLPMYEKYAQTVPKELRRPDMPRTPDIQDMRTDASGFHFEVQEWKKSLHELEGGSLLSQGLEVQEDDTRTTVGAGGRQDDTLKWRQKQIDFVKTPGHGHGKYHDYLEALPKEQRRPDMPQTPDIHKDIKSSRKHFSRVVRDWKYSINTFVDKLTDPSILDGRKRINNVITGDKDNTTESNARWNQRENMWGREQINWVYRTVDYKKYLAAVPMENRRPDMPKTPDVFQYKNKGMSKEEFHREVIAPWKNAIHDFNYGNNDTDAPPSSQNNQMRKQSKHQKDIDGSCNTMSYKRYLADVPKEKRGPDMPQTPEPHRYEHMSRDKFRREVIAPWQGAIKDIIYAEDREHLWELRKSLSPRNGRRNCSPRRNRSRSPRTNRSRSPLPAPIPSAGSRDAPEHSEREGRSGRRGTRGKGRQIRRKSHEEEPIVIGGARVPSDRAPEPGSGVGDSAHQVWMAGQQQHQHPRNPEPPFAPRLLPLPHHNFLPSAAQNFPPTQQKFQPPQQNFLPPQQNFPVPQQNFQPLQQNLIPPPLDNFPPPGHMLPPPLNLPHPGSFMPPPLNTGDFGHFNPHPPHLPPLHPGMQHQQDQFPGQAFSRNSAPVPAEPPPPPRFGLESRPARRSPTPPPPRRPFEPRSRSPRPSRSPYRRSPPRLSPGSSAMPGQQGRSYSPKPMDISPPPRRSRSRSPRRTQPRAGFSSDFSQHSTKTGGFGFSQTKFGEASSRVSEDLEDFPLRVGGVYVEMGDSRRDRSPAGRVSPGISSRRIERPDYPGISDRRERDMGGKFEIGREAAASKRDRSPAFMEPAQRRGASPGVSSQSHHRERDSGRRLSPEKEKEPQPQSAAGGPPDLSLSAHFCLRQKKLGRPAELGGDMMLTWRLVGHNEDTLRQLCRDNDPESPEKLRILLMRQIMHARNVPSTVDVGDVVEETVLYFMPFEEDLNPRHQLAKRNGNPITLEEKTLKFIQDLQAKKDEDKRNTEPSVRIPGEDEQRFSYVERIASLYGFQTFLIHRLRSIPEMQSIPDGKRTVAVENLLRDLASVGVHQSSLNKVFSRFGDNAVKDMLVGKLAVLERGFQFGINAKLIGHWACEFIKQKGLA